MKFIDLVSGSQTRRLIAAFILALPVPAIFLFLYLSIVLQYPAAQRLATYHKETLVLRSILAFFLIGLCAAHLVLDVIARKRSGDRVFHFSLLRLFACMLTASLFIGANFVPWTSPAFEIPKNGNYGAETITSYGFPRAYESVTYIHSNTQVLQLGPPNRDFTSLYINGGILLLFMANVLVLKFGKSENVASVPVSATPHASH